jgi:hypothetical protein
MKALVGKDPRSDAAENPNGNAQVGKPGSIKNTPNTNGIGGYKEIAAVDLGNGTAALATYAITRTTTTVVPAQTSTQLLPANVGRIAATILNPDPTYNLYIGLAGAAAVPGTNTVGPGQIYNVPVADVALQINGIWDTGATQSASILATT